MRRVIGLLIVFLSLTITASACQTDGPLEESQEAARAGNTAVQSSETVTETLEDVTEQILSDTKSAESEGTGQTVKAETVKTLSTTRRTEFSVPIREDDIISDYRMSRLSFDSITFLAPEHWEVWDDSTDEYDMVYLYPTEVDTSMILVYASYVEGLADRDPETSLRELLEGFSASIDRYAIRSLNTNLNRPALSIDYHFIFEGEPQGGYARFMIIDDYAVSVSAVLEGDMEIGFERIAHTIGQSIELVQQPVETVRSTVTETDSVTVESSEASSEVSVTATEIPDVTVPTEASSTAAATDAPVTPATTVAPTTPATTEAPVTVTTPSVTEGTGGTATQHAAVQDAKSYLRIMPFSREGLIDQLIYEGYSESDAAYGADNAGADWMAEAVSSAKNYLDIMAFSREGLIDQLVYEGFTPEQAAHGADNTLGDWSSQAIDAAKNYLSLMPFSRQGLIDQLIYEGYSQEEAIAGVDSSGADWMAEAVRSAENYLDLMPFTREEMINQLQYEGFTAEQAAHGATGAGL